MYRIIDKDGITRAETNDIFALDSLNAIPDDTAAPYGWHPADAAAVRASRLDAVRAEAALLVVTEADRYGALLTAGYPASEQASWTAKADEARAIAAGATPSSDLHPVIMAEAMFTGRAPAEIAEAVLAKAVKFARAAGAISGIRQAALARIDAATDDAGIAGALAWAKATAQAAFQGLQP